MKKPQETRVTRLSEMKVIAADSAACLVCIYGPELGKSWALSAPISIGRGPQNDIVLDLDNVSRKHCVVTPENGRVLVEDQGSTNGSYLNNEEISKGELRNGDHLKVGGAIFKFLSGGNIESLYHEEIYQMTIMDGLTQIHNKRYFLETLEKEMARSARFERPLHLVMFDVDHFKRLNDTYGHIAGDYVLRTMAGLVRDMVRTEETFSRYGGEEFCLLVPESPGDKVAKYAEKIRKKIEKYAFTFEDERLPVTISVGVAPMPRDILGLGGGVGTAEKFIKAADEKLYEAKHAGRNQVVAS